MHALPVALFCLVSSIAQASDSPQQVFASLHRHELKNEGVTLFVPADRAKPAPPPAWLSEYESAGIYASVPFTLRLGEGLPEFALTCDSGPSADPSCRLLGDAKDPEKAVFESAGTVFAFLPDARIYVSGHSNNFYNQHKLFRWNGSAFAEVAQTVRHVGVSGKARTPLTLRAAASADAAAIGVTVAAGETVTVLLNDNRPVDESGHNPYYLLLTREGITGWAQVPGKPDGSTDIDGLFFRGD